VVWRLPVIIPDPGEGNFRKNDGNVAMVNISVTVEVR
jgi:hypothetical protein